MIFSFSAFSVLLIHSINCFVNCGVSSGCSSRCCFIAPNCSKTDVNLSVIFCESCSVFCRTFPSDILILFDIACSIPFLFIDWFAKSSFFACSSCASNFSTFCKTKFVFSRTSFFIPSEISLHFSVTDWTLCSVIECISSLILSKLDCNFCSITAFLSRFAIWF